jgi:hypothetical protein
LNISALRPIRERNVYKSNTIMNRLHKKIVWVVSLLWLAACSRPGAAPSDPYQISLTPDPVGYPGEMMRVQIADETGAPVTDVTVSLEGNMNHAGMVPVLTESVLDEADGTADGIYAIPFSFTMLGDWIISVKVTPQDGETVTRNIDLRATENGVTIVQER